MTAVTTVPYDTMSTNSVNRERDLIFAKCCCCFPLRVGCFILGYLHLLVNTFHTLILLTLTTYIGITTHGFDHFDSDPKEIQDHVSDVEMVEKPILNQIGILLMLVVIANVVWLLINVACLVGLHKRRPGPIRIYVGFASARLLLSLAGFVYILMTGRGNSHTIITHITDLGIATYFILVYYIYAVQLDRELEAEHIESRCESTNEISIYPAMIGSFEKQHFVLA